MQFLARVYLCLLPLACVVSAHGRIKYPRPLNAMPDTIAGNPYNSPYKSDGSEFPCKNIHKTPSPPTATWAAGEGTYFEILEQTPGAGEGPLAAHSGGSCQASLSYDNGDTWKVLHSFEGGCPRGAVKGSNLAGPDQKFNFDIPKEAKAGNALFAWTWVAATGNRLEFYMDCASVAITGSGTSTLDNYVDMYVGEMVIPGHINTGECNSVAGTQLLYPNPGQAVTKQDPPTAGLDFQLPTPGKCISPGTKSAGTVAASGNDDSPASPPLPPANVSPIPQIPAQSVAQSPDQAVAQGSPALLLPSPASSAPASSAFPVAKPAASPAGPPILSAPVPNPTPNNPLPPATGPDLHVFVNGKDHACACLCPINGA